MADGHTKRQTIVTIGHPDKTADFVITSRCAATVRGFPFDDNDSAPRYRHRVTVRTGRRSFTEDYYTSIDDFRKGKDTMTDQDRLFALQCLADDARSGGFMDFEEFCSEFGYEAFEGSKKDAPRVYAACQRIHKKFELLGLGEEDDLIWIANQASGEDGIDYKIKH